MANCEKITESLVSTNVYFYGETSCKEPGYKYPSLLTFAKEEIDRAVQVWFHKTVAELVNKDVNNRYIVDDIINEIQQFFRLGYEQAAGELKQKAEVMAERYL